ncbi:hypothetical protein Aab01nite_65130 [Paractinoplanes abujensis]|uniref:Nucleoside-diphosphate-sugar epimerase n=1 Tax=Paractinoplanes abujensis TaxID=882441 RepID=A0A7W7CQ18_9ACTN|nr:NmrA family NAD(P)-binding protein [Actinoplanes abujensis]MBB4692578.1 nucleoside-diphosphate-sugar epimerase [Actinoplanes abujensis]GID22923.1 hypothetical protein Aab01nite_65130 [Actinoplanes abujensis]
MAEPVLVVGATGQQGGAAARALLRAGIPVRALVRDPATTRAKAVEAQGAELVTGDLKDRGALVAAAGGARAVFSVQMAEVVDGAYDFDGELRQAVNLIEAARAAQVPQFVQTSVSGSDRLATAPGHETGRWKPLEPYYATKTRRGSRTAYGKPVFRCGQSSSRASSWRTSGSTPRICCRAGSRAAS